MLRIAADASFGGRDLCMLRAMTIDIGDDITLDDAAIEMNFVRASGAGGQNVNKVATAVELRFDIGRSNLPDDVRERLLARADRRVSADGIFRIKAQRHRTQERNRRDALERLVDWIRSALVAEPERRRTRVPAAQRRRRLDEKGRRGEVKRQRSRPPADGS